MNSTTTITNVNFTMQYIVRKHSICYHNSVSLSATSHFSDQYGFDT